MVEILRASEMGFCMGVRRAVQIMQGEASLDVPVFSVGEIVRIVRQVETDDDPLQDTEGSPLGHMVVRPLWSELQIEVMRRLDDLSLDDLCNRANTAGIVSEGRQHLDFSI